MKAKLGRPRWCGEKAGGGVALAITAPCLPVALHAERARSARPVNAGVRLHLHSVPLIAVLK